MSYAGGAGSGAAAQQAYMNLALKAMGCIVSVEPDMFLDVVAVVDGPLVVTHEGGLFSTKYTYLVSHKGFVFHTKHTAPLDLPPGCQVLRAKKLWLPS